MDGPRRPAVGRAVTAAVAVLVATVVLVGAVAPPATPSTASVVRRAGADRVATAVAVSAREWPDGARQVVLVRSDDYPDALAAAPLAKALGAPLLLTGPGKLDERAAAEIDRLDAERAVLLGGRGALSTRVEQDARAHVDEVVRIGGADRFATAALVADAVDSAAGPSPHAYVARATGGKGWPDALTGAVLAARGGSPLLLADRDRLPYPPEQLSARRQLTLVGGPAVLEMPRGVPDHDIGRLAGADRYRTATAVADAVLTDLDDTEGGIEVWLATGSTFPDALAAGPAVAGRRAVLLLVPPTWQGSAAQTWIRDHADRIDTVTILGGTGVVPTSVAYDVATLLQPYRGADGGAPVPDGWSYALLYATPQHRSDLRPLDGATVRGDIFVTLGICGLDGTECVPLGGP